MKSKFAASVNINRDAEQELHYIPTSNAESVFEQIVYHFAQTKQRAFTIVGAYGSGKSVFLWAFQQTITKKKPYFSPLFNTFEHLGGFEVLALVGEPVSIIETFAETLDIKAKQREKAIFKALDKRCENLANEKKGLLIVLDEFGKFLEYAAKNNPESELYFIQQLAEWVSDETKNVLFITTLHQGFSAYSHQLTSAQRSEWRKVEGRLKELTFNEPVEQLLGLAAKQLETKQKNIPSNFNLLFDCIKTANRKLLRDNFTLKFAQSLYPFDILTATILTQALQRYGQNERSLFSFLHSNDYLGLQDFEKTNLPYFNLCRLYDYLLHNFRSSLLSRENPDFMQWVAIRNTIEKVEANPLFDEHLETATQIIKVIGLMSVFSSAGAKIDKTFIVEYLDYSANTPFLTQTLELLHTIKYIKFTKHNQRFTLFEGTDVNIDKEITKAKLEIDSNFDIVKELQEYFEFPYISAKKVLLEKGTPRIFAFRISEMPLVSLEAEGEIDGYINLIFSLKLTEEQILEKSKECKEAILFGYFTNTQTIRETITEIKAIRKVRIGVQDHDSVARKELQNLEDRQIEILNKNVLENLEVHNENIVWFFGGEKIDIQSIRKFNRVLSDIADKVYPDTPIYWNEMINVSELSGAMILARKNLFKKLIENTNVENIDFKENSFQPEKTIYFSLLKATGIHRKQHQGFILAPPLETSFTELWKAGEQFLEDAKSDKKSLQELFTILLRKPFKLKKGFLEFWLPLFLFIKRHDFALFEEGNYTPEITVDLIDVILKKPDNFLIKTFDVEGVKLDIFNGYRNLINKENTENATNEVFIETIKPFLTFYRGLDNYTKKTKQLQTSTKKLREVLATATEPEKAFFEDFPNALGYNLHSLKNDSEELEHFTFALQEAIRELRTCYDSFLERFEKLIGETTGIQEFPEYKEELQKRFKKVKKHALLPHQEVFYQRVVSAIDDRKAWLNSIGHACLGRHLDSMTDDDEKRLFDKFRAIIYELDNLSDIIDEKDFDADREDVFQIQLTSFVEGLKKRLIRLPKKRTAEMIEAEKQIKSILVSTSDKSIKIAILADLLQDELKYD